MFFEKGTPVTYIGLGLAEKITTLVGDHGYFIPIKFHQNPSSGVVVMADFVSLYIYMH